MVKVIQGQPKARGKTVSIVVSKFNEMITKRLLAGCLDELKKNGVPAGKVNVCWVPGSFELPVTALKLARKKNVGGVICLGAVIRGETFHFDLVATAAMQGILQASITTGKPVIFGVLTTDTVNQAYKRAQDKGENKGREAAVNVLEMIDLLSQV